MRERRRATLVGEDFVVFVPGYRGLEVDDQPRLLSAVDILRVENRANGGVLAVPPRFVRLLLRQAAVGEQGVNLSGLVPDILPWQLDANAKFDPRVAL